MDIAGIINDLTKILALVKPHAPWIGYLFLFAFVGEVSKRHLYSPGNVARLQRDADKLWNRGGKWGKVAALFPLALLRIPFAYHPMIVGFVVGLIPSMPLEAGVHYGTQSAVYVMSAGIFSLSLYALLERVWEFVWTYVLRKEGPAPDLPLPGEESDPTEEKTS